MNVDSPEEFWDPEPPPVIGKSRADNFGVTEPKGSQDQDVSEARIRTLKTPNQSDGHACPNCFINLKAAITLHNLWRNFLELTYCYVRLWVD